jgi:hypothetical protein
VIAERGGNLFPQIAYVDGPRLARRFGHSLIGSLAVICPACGVALAQDRGPRWVARPEFQTDVRPCGPLRFAECLGIWIDRSHHLLVTLQGPSSALHGSEPSAHLAHRVRPKI